MLTGWTDFDDTLRTFDRWQRRMDRALGGWAEPLALRERRRVPASWPPTNVFETPDAFVVKADVPGLAEGDVAVSVEEDVLVVRGERKAEVPAGYKAHLRERAPVAFTRKLAMPVRVDASAVTATLEHGVLTVTLPKSKEALPRQIAVKSARA
jgi:HSP20 family protein